MGTQSQSLYLLCFTSLLFLLVHNLPLSTADPADPPTPAYNATDFIRTSCSETRYPDVCYSSLIGYANSIENDPAQMALAAISVSLGHAREVASYISNLTRGAEEPNSNDRQEVSALQDCFSNFDDAVDEMRGSLKQMRQLIGSSSSNEEAFRFQMSNVQTWMSAALTDEETCTDGFSGVTDGPLKAEVCDRAEEVKKVTSNALALVNSYVNSKSWPSKTEDIA